MVTPSDAWASQLRKGVVELAVLAFLARGPRYGSQLVDDLAAHPALAITAGTVYPLLARLAKNGVVTTTWQESPSGPPRKYYRLTPSGQHRLRGMTEAFGEVSAAVTAVLTGVPDPDPDHAKDAR